MITPEPSMENLILALCDELKWGLRFCYAEKVLYESKLRKRSKLFDTFYWSCLDQSALILSRMVVAKPKFKDDALTVQYLLKQARKSSHLFHFSQPGGIEKMVETHFQLLESHKPFIDVLEDQRDRNLTHLDLKHVKQPEWRENQPQLDLNQVEKLYQDLIGVMQTYHQIFFGESFDFGEWQTTSQTEVEMLIAFYESYQSKI